MRLEGTLDAFSLPDIFQLLSFTKKTGTLHLHRGSCHGAVHLRDGAVTGGRADVGRQELGRRLLGAGLVDDEVLASAAEELAADPTQSLAQLLVRNGELQRDTATALAAEQVADAVFSLLRWPDGDFAFVVDEPDPDDLGAAVPVEEVVAEGQRRIEAWNEMVEHVPAPDVVVAVNPAPPGDVAAQRDEWSLLSLVDGRRTVADLVALSGRGEYAVVSALAGLISRRLLVIGEHGGDQLVRRQSLLAALEGQPEVVLEERAPEAAVAPTIPAPSRPAASPVIPDRPEPFTPARTPEHADETPAFARASVTSSAPVMAGGSAHGSVSGATALQPDAAVEATPSSLIERDPSVNKSLLLRLIAGVRGL